jgi:sigma-B regulation protein RsbU (phosphoserine phosphatase)
VVFCTAYDEYAIEAFEQHAADYLLKPVNRRRLAGAVERVRRDLAERRDRGREVDEASRTQARLLPQALPTVHGLEICGSCRAARGVGGDYYDFLDLGPGRLGIAVGDVSGKGLYAGLLVAGLQARVQSLAPAHGEALGALIGALNRSLHDSTESHRYATLFYALYDDATRCLSYVNAGQNPPLLFRSGGAVERLQTNATVVGLLPESRYAEQRVELSTGDVLIAFTDGVTEAANEAGEEFGEGGVIASMQGRCAEPAERVRDAILGAIERFVGGAAQRDDLTLVVARVV